MVVGNFKNDEFEPIKKNILHSIFIHFRVFFLSIILIDALYEITMRKYVNDVFY